MFFEILSVTNQVFDFNGEYNRINVVSLKLEKIYLLMNLSVILLFHASLEV